MTQANKSYKTRAAIVTTLLQSASNLSSDMVVPQTGDIAGVSFSDFTRLMTFINNDIKTNFIHYNTCFSGGYNQTFVNDELQKLNVNYIVASEGTSETGTFVITPSVTLNKNGQITLSLKKFTSYFGLLENFFGEPTKVVGMQAPQGWQKDPLAAIVGTLVPLDEFGTNQPFIRIPSAGVFTALNVDKQVKILTHSIVKAHESENRTIDCSNPEITIIFVYPKYIQVPLKIANHAAIVSPNPQSIEQLYHTTHIFEEIISTTTLKDVIANFIKYNSSYSKIKFIIKKLISTEKKPAENVFIQIVGKLDNDNMEIKSSTLVMYMINGVTMQLLIPPSTLGQDMNAFVKLYNKCKIDAITPEATSFHVSKLLSKEDIKELEGQPMTLANLIAQEEKKINKDFGVQKPGALKKVLLLKQLQGLEEATTQETLSEKLEWLQQTGKPKQQFISSLNHQKTELNKLANDFKQMVATKSIDKKEYADIESRIKTIETSLNATLNTLNISQPAQPAVAQSANLSSQEASELRQAIVDYKKDRNRPNAEQIINKYAGKYPNDQLVQSKLNEKAKFDASAGIKPQLPTQAPAQPAQPAVAQSANLSSQEASELRQAVVDYKKDRNRPNAEQIINKYASKYPNDPLVQSKLNEKAKFDASAGIKPQLPTQASAQPAQPAVAQSANLSPQEASELRQAIVDYKKDRNRPNAEQVINKYASK